VVPSSTAVSPVVVPPALTVTVVLPDNEPDVALTVDEPVATAVASPDALTVTEAVSSDAQATLSVMFPVEDNTSQRSHPGTHFL
jgi:hypothetical protein